MTVSGHPLPPGANGPAVVAGGPVTLVGGGPLSHEDLSTALTLAPSLVAADGGAAHLLAAGLTPVAVIGDMDSLPRDAARAFADRLHPVAEQDTTDFDKALSRIEAPLVLALGFSGGRLDHELAALHSLLLRRDRPCIVLGPESLCLHCPPRLCLALDPGTTVSLFPLAPARVASEGLRWPTAAIPFDPTRRVGTSNEATGPVVLEARGPGMLLILPRAALPAAAAAMLAAPRWPASRGG